MITQIYFILFVNVANTFQLGYYKLIGKNHVTIKLHGGKR